MELFAKDVMTTNVMSLSPLIEIGEAARLLTSWHVSGAPVVDPKGTLHGVVSQTDLTRFQGESAGRSPFEEAESAEPRDETPVVAVMTHPAVAVDEATPVEEVARLMLERRIHRVLITRQGKLCGIVTPMDLLRARDRT
jgi:CBS domain-containing protein